jgi:hypothetical protein
MNQRRVPAMRGPNGEDVDEHAHRGQVEDRRAVDEAPVVERHDHEHAHEAERDGVELLHLEPGVPAGERGGEDRGHADAHEDEGRAQEAPVDVEEQPPVDGHR